LHFMHHTSQPAQMAQRHTVLHAAYDPSAPPSLPAATDAPSLTAPISSKLPLDAGQATPQGWQRPRSTKGIRDVILKAITHFRLEGIRDVIRRPASHILLHRHPKLTHTCQRPPSTRTVAPEDWHAMEVANQDTHPLELTPTTDLAKVGRVGCQD